MSEVILNFVPKKKKYKGVRTSAIEEIKLQNYLPEESVECYENIFYTWALPFGRSK
jgi:hypothetical protein